MEKEKPKSAQMLEEAKVFLKYNQLLDLLQSMLIDSPDNVQELVEFVDEQRRATLDFIENEGSLELKEAIPYWGEMLQDDLTKPAQDVTQAVKRFAMVLSVCVHYDADTTETFVKGMRDQQILKSEFTIED